jgi:hypothetical protein
VLFVAIKNIKKKPTAVFLLKKQKSDSANQHRRPQKGQKNRFWFLPILFAFLCQAPRCGSKVLEPHRSEVNIMRVMTQNQKVGS